MPVCYDIGLDTRICPCSWCDRQRAFAAAWAARPALTLERRFDAGETGTDAGPFGPVPSHHASELPRV